jgi:hypothetical protein
MPYLSQAEEDAVTLRSLDLADSRARKVRIKNMGSQEERDRFVESLAEDLRTLLTGHQYHLVFLKAKEFNDYWGANETIKALESMS